MLSNLNPSTLFISAWNGILDYNFSGVYKAELFCIKRLALIYNLSFLIILSKWLLTTEANAYFQTGTYEWSSFKL